MRFHSIGTDNLRIGVSTKMGSCSLGYMTFTESPIRYYHNYEDNIKYVVLIRDVMDKYKSGYKQDLLEKVDNYPWPDSESGYYQLDPKPIFKSFFHRIFVTTKVESFESNNEKSSWGIDQIVNAHELNGGQRGDSSYRWLKEGHMLFKIWNQWQNDVPWTLMNLGELKNIYFLELKDLSNPKFLKWLQERDSGWECIEEIPHKNPSADIVEPDTQKKFKEGYNNFWNSYQNGKILKDKVLVNPFFDLPGNDLVDEFKYKINLVKNEQLVVDDIRENHKNYIRF